MKKSKVLFFDIETTPNAAYVWGPGKQHVSYESLFKEKKVSCISWKWLGENKVHHLQMNLKKHKMNSYDDDADKAMLITFSKIFNSADNAIGHNGIYFDRGTIIARLAKYGLPNLDLVILDDTYLQSKHIRFNCHKLDYLAKYFDVGCKSNHPYSLWVRVMQGDQAALDETSGYCDNDVTILEKVWTKLLPYIKLKFNEAAFTGNQQKCPTPHCPGKLLIHSRRMTSSLGIRVNWMCRRCNKSFTTGKNELVNPSQYPR